MVFVAVMWPDYELVCWTPSGRVAVGLTQTKEVRLLGRDGPGAPWRVLRQWPLDRLSHTDIISYLGDHPEPETPDGVLALLAPLERAHSGGPGPA